MEASSAALSLRSAMKARSTRRPSTTPEHADGRREGGEAYGPAAFHDVRVLHHALGFDLLRVVDARLLGAFVDFGLVRQVGRVGAVPVNVVLGHVEADAGHR